jgi:hypothetical protein
MISRSLSDDMIVLCVLRVVVLESQGCSDTAMLYMFVRLDNPVEETALKKNQNFSG